MRLRVLIADQVADLLDEGGTVIRRYRVSTAAKGAGERKNSNCTPRGRHVVRAKIGAGVPVGTVFVGRRPTGECYSPVLKGRFPDRDWILSRILWLSGCETGKNRLGDVDTMQRYIYLHGTPDDAMLGTPASHGCIRMANRDIVELFELLPAGSRVDIEEGVSSAKENP